MTTLSQISSTQSQISVIANANFAAVAPAGAFGKNHIESTGLVFGFYGATILVDGVLTVIANSTVLLTGSATNFIQATRAGVVSANTSAFTAGQIPLFEATTSASAITTLTDRRAWVEPSWVGSFLSKAFPSDANLTLSAAEARARIIRLTGTISTQREVFVPVHGEWTFHNATTGSPSSGVRITIAGSPSVGVVIANGMTARVYGDGGTGIFRASPDV